jgi:hypothetical protein
VPASRTDGVAIEEQHACRVDLDEVSKRVHKVLGGVWVPYGREQVEEWLRICIELLGGEQRALVARVPKCSRGEVETLRKRVGTPDEVSVCFLRVRRPRVRGVV